MIGGQGEKKTFRLAAQYAHELNTTALFADLPRKLDALQGHLDDLGRAREDITVSVLGTLVLAPTHDAAQAKLRGSSPPAAATSTRCSPTRPPAGRCSAASCGATPTRSSPRSRS